MQNLFHIFKLNTHHHYRHIDSLSADAEQAFYHYFHHLLPSRKAPVFLCIGTPLLSADRFGPYIGSQLKNRTFQTFLVRWNILFTLKILSFTEIIFKNTTRITLLLPLMPP